MRSLLDTFSKRFFLIVVMSMFIFSTLAFSQDVVGGSAPSPALITGMIGFLMSIPKVGPVLVLVFHWVGAISAIFTALTVFVVTVLKVPEVALRVHGADQIADKVQNFSAKVSNYLKYLSIFNAKKE